MPFSPDGKALMLAAMKGDAPTTPITHASLHTAAPGNTGANEVSGGGSPAYARKAVSFSAPNGEDMLMSGTVSFDVPPGTSVSHVGFWSAATGGVFLGLDLVLAETFAGQGTCLVKGAKLSIIDPPEPS